VINDILDFSRSKPTGWCSTRAIFEIEPLGAKRLRRDAPPPLTKGLELGFFMAQGVPEKAHGDAGRIRQILYNLVGNAIKFTEKGAVAISVAPAAGGPRAGSADQRFMVRFDVADTGISIPKDVLPNLFEQFAQADKTIARRLWRAPGSACRSRAAWRC